MCSPTLSGPSLWVVSPWQCGVFFFLCLKISYINLKVIKSIHLRTFWEKKESFQVSPSHTTVFVSAFCLPVVHTSSTAVVKGCLLAVVQGWSSPHPTTVSNPTLLWIYKMPNQVQKSVVCGHGSKQSWVSSMEIKWPTWEKGFSIFRATI